MNSRSDDHYYYNTTTILIIISRIHKTNDIPSPKKNTRQGRVMKTVPCIPSTTYLTRCVLLTTDCV